MKKLNLLIVVALLASALLMAAAPGKLVRLTVINQTGAPIYIKLVGQETGSFYYLTIPADADKDNGGMTFTVLTDTYTRTTYACDYTVSGKLIMTGNVKLNFVPCNVRPMRTVWDYVWVLDYTCDKCTGECVDNPPIGEDQCGDPIYEVVKWWFLTRKANEGEPTMETVSYFKYWTGEFDDCADGDYSFKTWRTPTGCFFRYR